MFRENLEAAGKRCSDYKLHWKFQKICKKGKKHREKGKKHPHRGKAP